MTELEIAQLRLKCAEPFVTTASKSGIEKSDIFVYAERMYEFVTGKKSGDTLKKEASLK